MGGRSRGLYARTAAQSLRAAPIVMAGCIAAVAAAAFAACAQQTAYLSAYDLTPGYLDSLIWLFSSHKGIPLLWCVAPAALMVWLVAAGRHRRGAGWAVRHGSVRELWVEDVADAVVGAAVFGAATMASACAAAWAFSGGAAADFGPHGVFAAVTEQVPPGPLDVGTVTAASAALSFLVLAVFGTAFQLGRLLLNGPAVPFATLVLLGLPTIHGPQAFLLEAARLLGVPVDPNGVTNPLSLPFEVSSVFYGSWLPGAGHGFWLQALLFAVLLALGLLAAPRKDRLRP
ncbi:hypothetical protein [Arabiibacter massiliensis]|uniref:hypothetical protein n=1 Tax=Arabiibacter massiliensis TaxID=1870985 RepID=UPI0009BA8F37|nr:hypothetical protein [Arabiibacter massiliensis]